MSKVTDWIQAISAAAGVIGLAIYALDTRAMKNATLSQNRAGQRPIFRVYFKDGRMGFAELKVENIGLGHALNFQALSGDGKSLEGKGHHNIIPVGEERTIHSGGSSMIYSTFAQYSGVRLTYEDISGYRYWTTYKFREGAKQEFPGDFVLEQGEEGFA